ncbi:hypothetical protein GCM10009647_018870 [Streptomyces sanglieri]
MAAPGVRALRDPPTGRKQGRETALVGAARRGEHGAHTGAATGEPGARVQRVTPVVAAADEEDDP